jgi:hypothetical protein
MARLRVFRIGPAARCKSCRRHECPQVEYFLRYQRRDQICPFEERFATERQAVIHAFAKVTQDFLDRVWIEDESGNVVVGEEDIRNRIKNELLT